MNSTESTENKGKSTVPEKIRKLLALAGDTPSESEAKSAFLMAQKLIATHGITEEELLDKPKDTPVAYEAYAAAKLNWWEALLATAVADNFRCYVYEEKTPAYRYSLAKSTLKFFGYSQDAESCAQLFNYIRVVIQRLSSDYASSRGKLSRLERNQIVNTYITSFLKGLSEALDKQRVSEEYALVLVIQPEVTDAFNDTVNARTSRTVSTKAITDREASIKGYNDGLDAGNPHERIADEFTETEES
jgi:hypothetical protein